MATYMFCNYQDSIRLEQEANSRKAELLNELRAYVNTPDPDSIGIAIRRVKHHFSGWSIEADLTFDGEVVRSYESFDLLELDLQHLMLKALIQNRQM